MRRLSTAEQEGDSHREKGMKKKGDLQQLKEAGTG
jgi:hypothetical protein